MQTRSLFDVIIALGNCNVVVFLRDYSELLGTCSITYLFWFSLINFAKLFILRARSFQTKLISYFTRLEEKIAQIKLDDCLHLDKNPSAQFQKI